MKCNRSDDISRRSMGAGTVAEGTDQAFTLVPQADRRQQPERRMFWRGGRRASDMVAIAQHLASSDLLWTASQHDRRATAKPQVH